MHFAASFALGAGRVGEAAFALGAGRVGAATFALGWSGSWIKRNAVNFTASLALG